MILLPFRNVTREPAHEWLTTGAPLMLAEALGQYRDLAIVAEERVTAARRRLGFAPDAGLDETQLLRLAEQTDGWTAVTGNVLAAGGRLRLTAQAFDIPTASVVARAEADAPADADVRQAFERLSVQLLEAVGVRAAPTDVAARTTHSVEAYRAYVRGIQAWQRSAYADARQAFGEAVLSHYPNPPFEKDKEFRRALGVAVKSIGAKAIESAPTLKPSARPLQLLQESLGRA